MLSLYPQFSMHLDGRPFEATVTQLQAVEVCVLNIGEPGSHPCEPLKLFFAFDKLEQVQRVADALNEIGKPSAASNPLAA